MDYEKKITEAELQMERLRRLKEEKESNIKKTNEEKFMTTKVVKQDLKKTQEPKKFKIEKRVFDKIYKIVKNINKTGKGAGLHISMDKFVNLILKRVLDLDLDYKMAIDRDKLEQLLVKLKKEE